MLKFDDLAESHKVGLESHKLCLISRTKLNSRLWAEFEVLSWISAFTPKQRSWAEFHTWHLKAKNLSGWGKSKNQANSCKTLNLGSEQFRLSTQIDLSANPWSALKMWRNCKVGREIVKSQNTQIKELKSGKSDKNVTFFSPSAAQGRMRRP